MFNPRPKSFVFRSQAMKNLESQSIIGDGSAKISKRSSNSFKFIAIRFHIGKIGWRNVIKLRLKMKNSRGLTILKVVLKTSPSIKGTFIRTNYRLKERWTNRAINPCANNVIKTWPFEIFRTNALEESSGRM